MRPIQVEAWALEIIDRIISKKPIEDSRVELKSDWIDSQKAARLIAGHANAARGEPILWLIGIDEEKGVVGVTNEELANWLSAVQSEFDGVAPELITDINVSTNGKVVVALYFETERAPYVVKNPSFGKEKTTISHEVPWREGRSTRTARRSDLIKVLVPVQNLPEMDILRGVVTLDKVGNGKWTWKITLETYIASEIGMPIVIPFHQCEGYIEISNLIDRVELSDFRITPPYNMPIPNNRWGRQPDSLTIQHTQDEVIIGGPGRLDITATRALEPKGLDLNASIARISIKMRPSKFDKAIFVEGTLLWETPENNDEMNRWILGSNESSS